MINSTITVKDYLNNESVSIYKEEKDVYVGEGYWDLQEIIEVEVETATDKHGFHTKTDTYQFTPDEFNELVREGIRTVLARKEQDRQYDEGLIPGEEYLGEGFPRNNEDFLKHEFFEHLKEEEGIDQEFSNVSDWNKENYER